MATANGDLKDLQRPWMLKAVLSRVGAQGGRLLEIGAGEPLVADVLQRLGHDVWIVDPYDGSSHGPRDFARFRDEHPELRFVRDRFTDLTPNLQPASFDCIYSISVLEHLPSEVRTPLVAGLRRFLKPEGFSIHAVDHVHRGRGAADHLARLRQTACSLGHSPEELDRVLAALSEDVDTYYLSAESHNRWRGARPYDEFPMRVCVSIHILSSMRSITTEEMSMDADAGSRQR